VQSVNTGIHPLSTEKAIVDTATPHHAARNEEDMELVPSRLIPRCRFRPIHAYKYISIRLPADRSNETPREATVSADQAVPYIDKVVDAHADTAQNVDV